MLRRRLLTQSTLLRERLRLLLVGIIISHYDSTFKSNHKLCLSFLKQFGFGRRVIEPRILMEVEEMVEKVREKQGRPFDMRQLATSCVANVMMSMLFGRRFDHSDSAFQQVIIDIYDMNANVSMVLELFPALHFLPFFKKLMAKELSAFKSTIDFISNEIAPCSQVCICTSWRKNVNANN